MLSRMDSRELVYWRAIARIEHEEYLQRKASARTEQDAAQLKAQNPRRNRSR